MGTWMLTGTMQTWGRAELEPCWVGGHHPGSKHADLSAPDRLLLSGLGSKKTQNKQG